MSTAPAKNSWPMWAIVTLAAAATAGAAEPPGDDAESAFFAGLDRQAGGRCDEAVPLFERSIELDPGLHQARLYLAECLVDLDRHADAVGHLQIYLESDFPEAERDRASELLDTCKTTIGEPVGQVPAAVDVASVVHGGTPDSGWARGRLSTGVAVGHFFNGAALTAVGPLLSGHVLAGRYVDLSLFGRVVMGPFAGQDGAVTVPEIGLGVALSLPVRSARITVGVAVPVALSRYGGELLVDGGVVGQAGVMGPLRGSRLVIGGQVEGGFLVAPVLGGSLLVGVQLGRMEVR